VPLYEFQCPKCGHRFERIQKFSDPDPKKCPECGAGKLERLLHAPAVQFKGSGWYVTDYGRNSSASSKSSEKSGESAGAKSDEKPKSDSAKSSSDKKK
jgi:putative FmdB family regulatory protein